MSSDGARKATPDETRPDKKHWWSHGAGTPKPDEPFHPRHYPRRSRDYLDDEIMNFEICGHAVDPADADTRKQLRKLYP